MPDQFRYLSSKRRRDSRQSVRRSKSSASLIRESSIQAENERLMDRLLSIKPQLKEYDRKESKKGYEKHIEYGRRIRKFSELNSRALQQLVHRFGID